VRFPGSASVLLAAVIHAACSVQPAPVHVEGGSSDLRLLAGTWKGSYKGEKSDRSGEIFFKLSAADADSAYGYVLMKVASKPSLVGYKSSRGFWTERSSGSSPNRLTISFVRAEDGSVRGTLNRYPDPDCGCTLHTTFLGRIERDSIMGTFKTLHLDSGNTDEGTWAVSRGG
jgi:hypothetical protein